MVKIRTTPVLAPHVSLAGAARRLAVIGYPLGHTLSPAIQNAALRKLGFDATYEAAETPPDQLALFLEQLRSQPEWLGANVTVPHKQAVMPFMDDLSHEARSIGAVNTISQIQGRLLGYNTDAAGFLEDLRAQFGSVDGSKLLVIGAGGAARAVCFALRSGPERVWVWNRHQARADALVQQFGGVLRSAVPENFREANILVNCTSAGLNDQDLPVPEEWLAKARQVYDLIYNPPTTRLMRVVCEKGGTAINGLGMLVRQGAAAFEIWTGQRPPLDVMFEAAREELARRDA